MFMTSYCLEVVKVKSSYFVMGYVSVLGGPYDTEQQAKNRIGYLEEKWHIQTKS